MWTVEKLQKQLETIQKQIQLLTVVEEEKKMIVKPPEVKPIAKLTFAMETPFILLPELGSVQNPLTMGKENSHAVSVGSRAWLKTVGKNLLFN